MSSASRSVRAVDRDYLIRPGDVVAVRNAAYTFDTQPGRPRPKRVENGQVAIVDSVDTKRDTLTLLLREPGAEPRLVEIDQAKLRAEHAAVCQSDPSNVGVSPIIRDISTLSMALRAARRATYRAPSTLNLCAVEISLSVAPLSRSAKMFASRVSCSRPTA